MNQIHQQSSIIQVDNDNINNNNNNNNANHNNTSSENSSAALNSNSNDNNNNNNGNIQQSTSTNVILQIAPQQQQTIRTSSSNGIHRKIVSASPASHPNQTQSRIQYLENFRISTAGSHLQSIGESTTATTATTTTVGSVQKYYKINQGYRIFKQNSAGSSSSSSMPTTVNLIPVSSITTSSGVHINQQFELSSLISSASKQLLNSSSSSNSEPTIVSTTPTSFSLAISSASGLTSSSSSSSTGTISNNTTARLIPRIPEEGVGVCKRCGKTGVKDTFYGKGKQFCSPQCGRGYPSIISGNHQPKTVKIIKMLSAASAASTNSSSSIGDGSDQKTTQQVVMLGTPITTTTSGAHNIKGLTSIQIPTQTESNKSPIIAVTSTGSDQDSSSPIPSSNIKPRAILIRQGTPLSQINRSGHPTLMNQKQFAQHLSTVTSQQQPNSIQVDPSNISIATNSATILQHQQQSSGGSPSSIKSVKRNYSKIVTVPSSGHQTVQATNNGGQIQIPSNGTLLAVHLGQNCINSNGQSPTAQVLQVPHQSVTKKLKRNSGSQQNPQSSPQINQSAKRSRSKSNSSTILSPSTSTQSFISMDGSNSSIISNSRLDNLDSSTIITATTPTASILTNEQFQNKSPTSTSSANSSCSSPSTSSNSILINQLKKPAPLVQNGSSSPIATTQSHTLGSSSVHSIQTNSSGQFLVQLAPITNSGLASNSSSTPPIQSRLRTATTLPASISNQQLHQILQQNNLRIQHQQVVGIHPNSTTQLISIRNPTMTSVSTSNNDQSQQVNQTQTHLLQIQPPSNHSVQVTTSQNQISSDKISETAPQSNSQSNPTSDHNLVKQPSNSENRSESVPTSTHSLFQPQTPQQQLPQQQQIKNVMSVSARNSMPPTTTSNNQLSESTLISNHTPPPPPPPPEPKPISRLEQIRALDDAIESTIQSLPPQLLQRQSSIINNNIIMTNYVNTSNNSSSQCQNQSEQHQSNNNNQKNNYYPPIWWLIFEKYGYDRCVPVWAFPNIPLNVEWSQMFHNDQKQQSKNIYVELKLSDTDLNGNRPQPSNGLMSQTPGTPQSKFKSKTDKSFDAVSSQMNDVDNIDDNNFWIAKIVGHSGYYLRLRFLGLEHINSTKYDFWVNIRVRNLFPIGYAQQNRFNYRAPFDVSDLNPNFEHDVRQFFSTTNISSIESDLHSLFLQQIETELKPGLKVEAFDKTRFGTFRVATIQQVIGQRCFLRYDGEPPNDVNPGWWAHMHSEQIRPVGWSQLVGHKLFASHDYANKSLRRGIQNILHNIQSNKNRQDWNKLGVLKKFEYINEEAMFREGMKLEAVNPIEPSQICVATVRKVLRFNFLVLSIDDWNLDSQSSPPRLQTSMRSSSPNFSLETQTFPTSSLYELEDRLFCVHASSPYILPAGFCKIFNIPLQAPLGYKREFDWVDYCQQTNSLMAPTNLFSYKQFISDIVDDSVVCPSHLFEEGMLLEAVDIVEPNLICLAVIKRRCGRLLLLHFIGWKDIFDQWCDCCSPNIFPVGYCDLIEYPLQSPPSPNSNGKKKRQYSPQYNNFNNRRKNAKKSPMLSSPTKSPLSKNFHSHLYGDSLSNDDSMQSSSPDCTIKNSSEDIDDLKMLPNGNFDESFDDFQSDNINSSSESFENNDDENTIHDEKDNEENANIFIQILDRENSELYNFLSWNEEITNIGRFDYHNKFTIPLSNSYIDIFGANYSVKDPLLKQKNLNFKLENDGCSLEIHWTSNENDRNRQLFDHDDYDYDDVEVYDSYHYFNPNDIVNETSDIRTLPQWSPKQVSRFLFQNGFADLCDGILIYKIDGKRLLSLTKHQSLQIALTISMANRLLLFVDIIRKKLFALHNQNQQTPSSKTIGSSSFHYR